MAAHKGNKYALGHNFGRPAHYETVEDLYKVILEFFTYCETNNEKVTITGLALYLGFESRQSLDDYINRSKDFSYIIKRAKLVVENSYENSGQTIDIFALKNMGWRDQSQTEITGRDGRDLFSSKTDSELAEIFTLMKKQIPNVDPGAIDNSNPDGQ